MNKQKLEELSDILLDGLLYDGSHHKQYYIYKALLFLHGSKDRIYKKLADDEELSVEEYIEEYGEFDEGVGF